MKLSLDMCGTDDHVALGASALLEANVAPHQHTPAADLNPRAMSSLGRLLSRNVCHSHTIS